DVALAYAAMAGPDPRDPKTEHQPPVHLDGWNRGDLEGVRLGIWDAWFRHADPDVVQSCENLLRRLQDAGAQLREIKVPDLNLVRVTHLTTTAVERPAGRPPF